MILVCGEALVDLFVFGQNGPRLAAEAVAGGSPYNVAIGLARLGCPSAFCGGLSTDRFGELLTGQLELEGVALDHAVRKAELTTISVVATDAHGVPLYSFHGEGAADRSITAADLKIPLPEFHRGDHHRVLFPGRRAVRIRLLCARQSRKPPSRRQSRSQHPPHRHR